MWKRFLWWETRVVDMSQPYTTMYVREWRRRLKRYLIAVGYFEHYRHIVVRARSKDEAFDEADGRLKDLYLRLGKESPVRFDLTILKVAPLR